MPVKRSESRGESSGVTKRSRAGRPPLPDTPIEGDNFESLRKERIRLAQRTYRNRKDSELAAVKERADRLESSLQKIVRSFAKFQDLVLAERGVEAKVLVALSRTGIEIGGFEREARGEGEESSTDGRREDSWEEELISPFLHDHGSSRPLTTTSGAAGSYPAIFIPTTQPSLYAPETSSALNPSPDIPPQPSNSRFPYTVAHSHLPFAERLRLCCVERGLQLLSLPTATLSTIHPSFALHLFSYPHISIPYLRYLTETVLHNFPHYYPGSEPDGGEEGSLEMFRSVEGGVGEVVKRGESLGARSLVFGRTRTIIRTRLPGYEGEWFEPGDVSEYLEARGLDMDGRGSPVAYSSEETAEGIYDSVLPFRRSNNASRVTVRRMHAAGEAASSPFIDTAIDIQSLIEAIATSSVCIGPGPGNRRFDIDRALNMAMAGV